MQISPEHVTQEVLKVMQSMLVVLFRQPVDFMQSWEELRRSEQYYKTCKTIFLYTTMHIQLYFFFSFRVKWSFKSYYLVSLNIFLICKWLLLQKSSHISKITPLILQHAFTSRSAPLSFIIHHHVSLNCYRAYSNQGCTIWILARRGGVRVPGLRPPSHTGISKRTESSWLGKSVTVCVYSYSRWGLCTLAALRCCL